jgi:hypothetical protein
MVRRDDHDGVDVRAGQQLAVVVVAVTAAIRAGGAAGGVGRLDALLGFVPAHCVHVADGQHLDLRVAGQPVQMALAHAPVPDQTHGDPLTRRGVAFRTPHRGGDHPGDGNGARKGRGARHEAASRATIAMCPLCHTFSPCARRTLASLKDAMS